MTAPDREQRESSDEGTCALCRERVPIEFLRTHLLIEHEIDTDFETWPDGAVVIVDETLEPEDFA